jgi:hypothetical protein
MWLAVRLIDQMPGQRFDDVGIELGHRAEIPPAGFHQLCRQHPLGLFLEGEVQADQAREAVADLLERSRKNSERLLATVRQEVRSQITSLGLASQADLDRMEERVQGLVGSLTGRPTAPTGPEQAPAEKKATGKKKTTGKKATKKKAAKKATKKKAAATKSAKKA